VRRENGSTRGPPGRQRPVPSSEAARGLALGVVSESRYDDVNRQWQVAETQEQPLERIIEAYSRRPSAFFT
jgi:hypothetical protein